MNKMKVYADREVIEIFDKFYFLETSVGYIKCCKESKKTIEVISEGEMKYLKNRYIELK
jgi:hypothetical protein